MKLSWLLLSLSLYECTLHCSFGVNALLAMTTTTTSRGRRIRKSPLHVLLAHPPSTASTTTTRMMMHTTASATQTIRPSNKHNFLKILQESCHTPHDLLVNIGQHLTITNNDNHPSYNNNYYGHVSSLVLVRLAKMLIILDNKKFVEQRQVQDDDCCKEKEEEEVYEDDFTLFHDKDISGIENIFQVFHNSIKQYLVENTSRDITTTTSRKDENDHDIVDLDWIVDGIKAGAVVYRILYSSSRNSTGSSIRTSSGSTTTKTRTTACCITTARSIQDSIIVDLIDTCHEYIKPVWLKPHQLTGLIWSFDTFDLILDMDDEQQQQQQQQQKIQELRDAYRKLNIPFRIRPGFLWKKQKDNNDYETATTTTTTTITTNEMDAKCTELLSLQSLKTQVDFQKEEIITSSKRIVPERRETAWQGEEHVPGFAYSGKIMERQPFSPVVGYVRDFLLNHMGVYYDCCLLNLYPDGDSGMNYHVDPDQGTIWGYDTCVVSVGATRRFSFRDIPKSKGGGGGDDQDASNSAPYNFVVMEGDVTHMFDDCQFRYQHAVKTADARRGEEKASRSSLVFKKYIL